MIVRLHSFSLVDLFLIDDLSQLKIKIIRIFNTAVKAKEREVKIIREKKLTRK